MRKYFLVTALLATPVGCAQVVQDLQPAIQLEQQILCSRIAKGSAPLYQSCVNASGDLIAIGVARAQGLIQ